MTSFGHKSPAVRKANSAKSLAFRRAHAPRRRTSLARDYARDANPPPSSNLGRPPLSLPAARPDEPAAPLDSPAPAAAPLCPSPQIRGKIEPLPSLMDLVPGTSIPITELLRLSQQGDTQAEDYFFRAVFGQLRRIAAASLRREGATASLEPTELVNEAYIHLFGERCKDFKNREHFFRVAARAMRCVLIDIARKRKAAKRDNGLRQVSLDEVMLSATESWPDKMLALESALLRLAQFDPRAAEILELKAFLGFTDQQVADCTGIGIRTVKRDFKAAKAWLQAELSSLPSNA